MKTKATKLFDDAAAKLNQAKEEIFRPQEDLVSFVVCKNSQFAIENFLKGYLMNNNVDPSKYNTLDLLLSKCKKINKKFKSISLSPLQCTSHDLETKMKHARRFLLEGDKVKVNLRFSGREMAHQDIGLKTLKKFAEALSDISSVETHPKLEGRQMFLLLGPDPTKIKELEKAQKAAAKKATPPPGYKSESASSETSGSKTDS